MATKRGGKKKTKTTTRKGGATKRKAITRRLPKTPAARATQRRRRGAPLVELHDLDLAAGVLADGSRFASLREMADPDVPTKSLNELGAKELAAVVIARLERTAHRRMPLRMLGVQGAIDNDRAIREVRELTPVGLLVMEIEQRFIRFLMEAH